jgi:pyrimidine deaminase RibD-like protein
MSGRSKALRRVYFTADTARAALLMWRCDVYRLIIRVLGKMRNEPRLKERTKMSVVAGSERTDESFMKRALLASQKALPGCLPNPPVGCILVREGAVLGEGYTHAPGQFHAEAHAVSQTDCRLDSVTAYVTLEPCSFRGRTASCALMLVERGVSRVVVSLLDPDPRNNGKGISILRSAGIAVTVGILESEVRKFIGQYLDLPANRFPSCGCSD